MTEELKECQLCHQMLPKSDFYKRKDRDGEYTWTMSYCGPCDMVKVKQSKVKNPEHYKVVIILIEKFHLNLNMKKCGEKIIPYRFIILVYFGL